MFEYGFLEMKKIVVKAVGLEAAALYAELLNGFCQTCNDGTIGEDDFFPWSMEKIKEGTTLTPYQQRRAREKLLKVGLISEKLKGAPPCLYFRVNENREVDL